jgi:hypothetical protein
MLLLNLQQKSLLVEQIKLECSETYILNPRMGALMKEVYTSNLASICLVSRSANYAGRARINITLSRHQRSANHFSFAATRG